MAFIELKGIRKDYFVGKTRTRALRGIDLKLGKGQFSSIWGPSGSGKTTLLNVIGTIDEPSSGELVVGDLDVFSLSDHQRTEFRNKMMGFIFQGFNLIPVLTALENVMLPLQIRGQPTSLCRTKAIQYLKEVELEDLRAQQPDLMSGGERQRVAIARALVNEPSLIIADEPTANLDSTTARMIMDLMQALNQRKKSIFIFSTHDPLLLKYTQRVISLQDGLIVS